MAQPVEFTIAGTGQLPDEDAQGAGGGSESGRRRCTGAGRRTRPGGGLGAPDDPEDVNDPWSKYKWWILSALGLALVCGAGYHAEDQPGGRDGPHALHGNSHAESDLRRSRVSSQRRSRLRRRKPARCSQR